MSNTTYTLSLRAPLLNHGPLNTLMLRDGDEDVRKLEIDASVRSGDYFVTLATILETVIDELLETNSAATLMLDQVIEDLDYLQQHYAITKKIKHDTY